MRRLVLGLILAASAGPSRGSPVLTDGAESRTWSFAVLGDNRDDSEAVFPSIAARIHDDPEFAFTLHLGDMVPSGGEAQLKDFLRVAGPLRGCLFPVVGNHEIYRDPDREGFKAMLGLKSTSYSFDFENAHFAVIDDASQEFSPGVLAWLRADLAKHGKGTSGVEIVVVAMHIPPALPGLNVHVDGDKAERFQAGSTELLALLREYRVDVVFAGHLHDARTLDIEGGPRLVISGAAGAPQGWLKKKVYGYHRVTVRRREMHADFVEVRPGAPRASTATTVRRQACPTSPPAGTSVTQ